MSKVHYFQRYSQRENVVTNNTLLLLSRLYAHNVLSFEAFLADLLEDEISESDTLEIGVRFSQQAVGSGKSIPDGVLEQRSFKLVLETKLHSKPDLDQLVHHLDSFGNEERQILLVLTPAQPGPSFLQKLRKAVDNHNQSGGRRVQPVCTTFREVIRSYRDALAAHDREMLDLLLDYEDFCATFEKGRLLPRDAYTMRVVPCGKTFEDNIRHALYYQPATRPYRGHDYLGIYKDKRVRYIGRIQAIVKADLVNGELAGLDGQLEPTEENRIKEAIEEADNIPGYAVATGHRFFLVKEFHQTAFAKVSPGGLQSQRYFDLADELGLDDQEPLPPVEDVAEQLKGRTWS